MKKLKVLLLSVLVLVPFLLAFPVFAQDKDETILRRGEVVEGNYYKAGNRVVISGIVNGDVYVAGSNVVVDGTVNGDLLIAGGNVDIRGTVVNDVRVAGGVVEISGNIDGNVSAFGGKVNIIDTGRIGGSLVASTSDLNISGPIGKTADFTANNAVIANSINGNVNATVNKLVLTSQAMITGDLVYQSSSEAQIGQGAVISGDTTRKPVEGIAMRSPQFFGLFAGFAVASKIISFISYLIVGVMLLALFPIFTSKTPDIILKKPGLSFLIGLLTIILFPIVFVLLFVTIIGIPLAFILLAVFFILIYLSVIIVSLAIGGRILKTDGSKGFWSLLLGLIIYHVIGLIPIVGGIFSLIVIIFGLGSILYEESYFYKELRSKEIV